MDESAIAHIILESTYTKPQLIKRLQLLGAYAELVSFTKLESTLSEYLSLQNVSQAEQDVIAVWYDTAVKLAGGRPLVFVVKQFEKIVPGLPTLTLYLPTTPDEETLKKTVTWFRENLNPEILLDLVVKPELVAGCAYVLNGTYHDFSLHYFFTKHKDQIKQVLDEYTKTYNQ